MSPRALAWVCVVLLRSIDASKVPDRPDATGATRAKSLDRAALGMNRQLPGVDGQTVAERERQILDLSWQLQRDSSVVRMRQQANSMLRSLMAQRAPRVVVVSNRLPMSVKRAADGRLEYSVASGGMVSSLLGVKDLRMIWVGWAAFDDATPAERVQIRRAMWARGCVPIFLEKEVALVVARCASNMHLSCHEKWRRFPLPRRRRRRQHRAAPCDAPSYIPWIRHGNVDCFLSNVYLLPRAKQRAILRSSGHGLVN